MVAITHGMNPDEVEGLANRLKQASDQIRQIVHELNGRVGSTTWVGPDSHTFKGQWWPEHRQHLLNISSAIDGFGNSARNNACEQRNVSSH